MNNIIITQNSIFELIAGDTINNIGSQIQANTNGNATIYAENNINNETTKVRINQGGNNYLFNLPPFGKKSPLFLLYPYNIHMVF